MILKLAELLLEITKLKITQSEFVNNLQPILIEEAKVLIIWEMVNKKNDLLTQILMKTDINHLKFSSLNWRLEHTVNNHSIFICI